MTARALLILMAVNNKTVAIGANCFDTSPAGFLPLPVGEGRGEGMQSGYLDVNPLTRHAIALHPLPQERARRAHFFFESFNFGQDSII
jgi:hypothetical protein